MIASVIAMAFLQKYEGGLADGCREQRMMRFKAVEFLDRKTRAFGGFKELVQQVSELS